MRSTSARSGRPALRRRDSIVRPDAGFLTSHHDSVLLGLGCGVLRAHCQQLCGHVWPSMVLVVPATAEHPISESMAISFLLGSYPSMRDSCRSHHHSAPRIYGRSLAYEHSGLITNSKNAL